MVSLHALLLGCCYYFYNKYTLSTAAGWLVHRIEHCQPRAKHMQTQQHLLRSASQPANSVAAHDSKLNPWLLEHYKLFEQ
jgi:hypothetical protein